MRSVAENLQVMKHVDQTWNERDWAAFERLHAENVFVRFTLPEGTMGRAAHLSEAQNFLSAFPDHKIEFPHLTLFGQGDMVCSIVQSTGTHSGPWKLPDGRLIPTTGKRIEINLITMARILDGKLVEKNVYYDTLAFMTQIGVVKLTHGTVKMA